MRARHNIKIDLNSYKSIDDAIAQLQDYKNNLKSKTQIFLERLADKGITVCINSVQGDSHHFEEMVTFEKKWNDGVLYLIGRNDNLSGLHTEWYDGKGNFHTETISPILALEFGTAGLAIKGHGGSAAVTGNHIEDTEWYYYTDINENGKPINPHYATAEEAHEPMFKAWEEMVREVNSTAKKVFAE